MKARKRILVIDDEPNLLRAVEAVLRGAGFSVTIARNSREALFAIARTLPDLIVSDIRMPGMDGFALARKLRAATHTAIVPIIFLTALDETEDRVEGFRAGVDVYLTKPFEPDELVAVIRNILKRVENTHTTIAEMVGTETEEEENNFIRDEELTKAEWRIAKEVALGSSNKKIADDLNLSIRTVENHVSRILAKKNFTSRVDIARYLLSKQTATKKSA
ncbi:MAG: response regulator transcription factor [Acidobacteriota bacterium]|jgi:DNA-binding NarL/FixJ family response regulator|nr:response regulator transcription factor [Acidobacteriota bacterium]